MCMMATQCFRRLVFNQSGLLHSVSKSVPLAFPCFPQHSNTVRYLHSLRPRWTPAAHNANTRTSFLPARQATPRTLVYTQQVSPSTRLYSWRRYTPLPRPNRFGSFIDNIPHDFIIYGILAANGAVFVMWYLAQVDYKTGDPSSMAWMRDHFTMSLRNLTSSRPWVLVTSIFSHSGIPHILFNCFTFYFMAPAVLSMLGTRSFLALYFGGGIFANLFSSSYNKVVKGRDLESVGASAAIYSAVTFLACAAPRTLFYIYGVVPVPAWLLVPGIFAFDTWSSVSNRETRTDSMGHVGGILAGLGYFLARRFGVRL